MRALIPALLLMVLITGCGELLNIDPAFQPYLTRFEQIGNKQVSALIMQFGNIPPSSNELGGCDMTAVTPWITINQDSWDLFDDAQREELVFHELGHCILGREHDLAKNPDGTPVSLMFPDLLPEKTYVQHRSEYIRELFSGS